MNKLQELYEEISKCNKCGFCQSVCPVFQETRIEGSVARGRLALIRETVEGQIAFDHEFKDTLYECLLCKNCVENCPGGVIGDSILLAARETMAANHIPLVQKLVFNHLLKHPKRLSLTGRLLQIYEKTGLRKAFRKTGLIGLLGPLAKSEDFLPKIANTFRDLQGGLAPNPQEANYKVSFFLGCGTNLLKPSQGFAAVNTLRKLGCFVQIPETLCCSLPAVSYGHSGVAQEMAKKNIELLLAEESDYIVSDCASCSSALKDYPKLFKEDDAYYQKALDVACKVHDYAQLTLKLSTGSWQWPKEQVVTYHVPCHLARGLKAGSEPKKLLADIKGLNYVELPEADYCCGAAGSYFITYPELSEKVLRRKMQNIKKTGASLVATSCPACVMQLERGARMINHPVKVMHIAEIIEGIV